VVPVFIAILAAADYCAVASLFVVGTNYVWAAAYPQPLIVALWLMARASSHHKPPESKNRLSFAVLAVAIAIFSIRAVALTTWGVISSIDFGKSSASREIRRVLDGLPDGAEIIVSSPYLYDLAGQQRLKTFHADWIGPYGEPGRVNPAVMVLTPYDYFRRFESELKEKDRRHHIARWEVLTMQRVPVPDQFPAYQRLVQHISWAPVIVQVEWR
jgi:hypothetical protein